MGFHWADRQLVVDLCGMVELGAFPVLRDDVGEA
jgi:hypothetical protein